MKRTCSLTNLALYSRLPERDKPGLRSRVRKLEPISVLSLVRMRMCRHPVVERSRPILPSLSGCHIRLQHRLDSGHNGSSCFRSRCLCSDRLWVCCLIVDVNELVFQALPECNGHSLCYECRDSSGSESMAESDHNVQLQLASCLEHALRKLQAYCSA